ncbi:MAG: hypothetical protein AB7S77_11050 [Desulfatirhabdiaceae bacterium]
MTIDNIKNANDLDEPWPPTLLLDAIGFPSRIRGRVEDYLERQKIRSLSLRELMDLFLPAAIEPPVDEMGQFWMSIPMLRQPQFGPYLHDSALLTLTEATMSQEFKTEWAMRICRMMLYELRERPANKRLQRSAKKCCGR